MTTADKMVRTIRRAIVSCPHTPIFTSVGLQA